jgi:2-oxoglutarate ferredoxin oxidoreductase subunit gamma
MGKTEVRLTGLGGQGVVLSCYIVGRACAVHAGGHATMIQSFGPEARGSTCSAALVVSDSEVLYPYVQELDVLVAMSADGFQKYDHQLKEDGILIHEEDLVHPTPKQGQSVFAIPSTRIAESLGRSIVQNIVMLGFFTAVTGIVSQERMREAVKASVPKGTEDLNLTAFDAGWSYFQEHYAQKESENQEKTARSGTAV